MGIFEIEKTLCVIMIFFSFFHLFFGLGYGYQNELLSALIYCGKSVKSLSLIMKVSDLVQQELFKDLRGMVCIIFTMSLKLWIQKILHCTKIETITKEKSNC